MTTFIITAVIGLSAAGFLQVPASSPDTAPQKISPASADVAGARSADEVADLADEIHEGRFRAGAEVRYQQAMVDLYGKQLAGWGNLATGFAIGGFLFAFVFGNLDSIKPDWGKKYHLRSWLSTISLFVGFLGFYASTRSGDNPASEKAVDHVVLEKRWTALLNDWKRLELEQAHLPPSQVMSRVLALLSEQASIQSAEPRDIDDKLWDRSWVIEAQVRNLPVPPKPDPEVPGPGPDNSRTASGQILAPS
jgi:hypothetical protein